MSAPARQRLHVDERKSQLLDLAIALFGDRSYEEISIDEFAKRGGISKGLLYHYFPSKRALYVAAVKHAAERLLEETKVEPTSDAETARPGPHDALRQGLAAYLRYVEEHAAAYAFLLRSGVGSDDEVAAIVEETRSRFASRVGEGIGLDEGDAEGRLLIRGWIGFVEATSLAWAEERSISRERLLEITAGAFLLGYQLTSGAHPLRKSTATGI